MRGKFLARYPNIVSFDDVKAASKLRRAREGSDGGASTELYPGYVYYDLSRFADSGVEPRSSQSQDEGEQQAMSRSVRDARTSRKGGMRDGRANSVDRTAKSANRRQRTEQTATSEKSRKSRDSKARRSSTDGRKGLFENIFNPGVSASGATNVARHDEVTQTARERRRSERTKQRAEKLFEKQYDFLNDIEPSDRAGAPRAALYETKMGTSHRRAARMQRVSEAGSSMAKINPIGWFANIKVSPRRMKVTTVILCLVLTVLFLYTPAQHYYQSVREHDRLAAEYAVVEERNATLAAQNESLASDAGMEDAARQKYGYALNNDEVGVVTGLSESATSANRKVDNVEANVLSSSVKAPEEWYTPYLDALFGVS